MAAGPHRRRMRFEQGQRRMPGTEGYPALTTEREEAESGFAGARMLQLREVGIDGTARPGAVAALPRRAGRGLCPSRVIVAHDRR
jgi:hypothetical protein